MRFTRLRLTNFRNFVSLKVSFGARVLIFGPNGAGKSNLLDSLRFVAEVASAGGGLRRAVEARGGRFLRSMQAPPGADFKIELEAEIEGEPWGYGLALAADRQGAVRVRGESVSQGRRRLLRRPEAEDRREPSRLDQAHLEQASMQASFAPLVEFLRSVRWFPGAGGPLLAAVLAAPRRQREARLRRVIELLRAALPRLDRLTVEHDDLGVPRLIARFDRGKRAVALPTEQLSGNTLRLMAMLWEASSGAGPLLLEEPEQGLHPEAAGRLLELLPQASGGPPRQLLIATHAERLLDDVRVSPSEILLLNATSAGTHAEVAAEDTQVRAAVSEEGPLGAVIAARTSPSKDGQIPLLFESF